VHIIKERSRPGGRPDDPSQPYESMLFNTFPNIPVVYPRSTENGSQCCGGLSVSESMFERAWVGVNVDGLDGWCNGYVCWEGHNCEFA
jgi:hypothetical protein